MFFDMLICFCINLICVIHAWSINIYNTNIYNTIQLFLFSKKTKYNFDQVLLSSNTWFDHFRFYWSTPTLFNWHLVIRWSEPTDAKRRIFLIYQEQQQHMFQGRGNKRLQNNFAWSKTLLISQFLHKLRTKSQNTTTHRKWRTKTSFDLNDIFKNSSFCRYKRTFGGLIRI